jgi:hypothetical protein
LDSDRAAVEKSSGEATAAVVTELNSLRDQVNTLTASLLNRTDELRTLDTRRAELATDLDLSSARERELRAALDEQKRSADEECAHWKEEARQLRELLGRRVETPVVEHKAAPALPQQPPVSAPQPTSGGSAHVIPRETPVLGSIVQQFDKLRQQRASDRSANRPR